MVYAEHVVLATMNISVNLTSRHRHAILHRDDL